MNTMEDVSKLIMHDEGTGPVKRGRLMPYTDSRGYTTIGYGRNLSARGISQSEAYGMLLNDLKDVQIDICQTWPWVLNEDPIRWQVFVSLLYNMGKETLEEFVKMLTAWRVKDYERAADELYASDWYTEVGHRGPRLVWMLRHGTMPEENIIV